MKSVTMRARARQAERDGDGLGWGNIHPRDGVIKTVAEIADRKHLYWGSVALEASLFFSFPAWVATADAAWPPSNIEGFLRTLALGAAVSLVFFHVLPGLWGQRINKLSEVFPIRILGWLLSAWMIICAILTLGFAARLAGGMHRLGQYGNEKDAITAIVLYTVFAVLIAMFGLRRQKIVGIICCGIGICFLVALFIAQWPGLWIRNSSMSGEPHGYPLRVFEAILTVAAPAAVVGFRMGRLGASTRSIWTSGLLGIVLPIMVATTLASYAKVGGARLHWKPSLPIEFTWAMHGWSNSWILQTELILAGISTLGTCIVCAMWLAEGASVWTSKWGRPLVMIIAVGCALTFDITDKWGYMGAYYQPLYWSVLTGTGIFSVGYLFNKVRLLLLTSWAHR